MNITSLECPSCGGKLKPMKGNPQIMVCEYCGKQCMVDNNVTVNYKRLPAMIKPEDRELFLSLLPVLPIVWAEEGWWIW